MRHVTALISACLLVGALGTATASAAEVLHVDGDRATVQNDPYLPPASATDLPPVPPGTDIAGSSPVRAAAGPSAGRAISTAVKRGTITSEQAADFRRLLSEARSTRGRLDGSRRAQLASVISVIERIARSGRLSAGRMPALFLQLRRNTEFFGRRSVPANATRVTFADSPIVFQQYAGLGLQFQPLANFGKLNALYGVCHNPQRTCPKQKLRSYADWMLALASRRGTFTTWEYFFSFGGGAPPWTSGISQGTGIQALSRAYNVTRDRAYLDTATRALGAFETSAPTGLRKRAPGGSHYLIYSFAPRLEVLNSFLQSVIGLYDYAKISDSPRGLRLFRAGDRAARRTIPSYDTGSWSLYSKGGRRADRGYHELVTGFLENLCKRTEHDTYCRYADKFNGYMGNTPGGGGGGGGGKPGPKSPTPTEPDVQPQSPEWRVAVKLVGTKRVLDFTRP